MGASTERIRADIEAIAACSSSVTGTNRLTFTPEYWAAVDYVSAEMAALGYERRTSVHGNTRFRAEESGWEEPAVAVGSHLDAVPHGGRFDGVAGVVAGIEVARLAADAGMRPARPYELIVFAEEEGSRFGRVLAGSQAFAGRLTLGDLGRLEDAEGVSYLDALSEGAAIPLGDRVEPRLADEVAAYFELHIEQSVVLETADVPLGIVTAIVGLRQFRVTYSGQADHAGATPMRLRRDSLAAAAQAIASVEKLASDSGTLATVGTVGMVLNEPNAANVIPGQTVFSVDIRDADPAALEVVSAAVVAEIERIADERRVRVRHDLTAQTTPVMLSARLRAELAESARRRGIDYLEMLSGAAHDAQEVARVAEAGMVFVPSIGGRSHCPQEDTPPEAIALAVDVLFDAVQSVLEHPGEGRQVRVDGVQ